MKYDVLVCGGGPSGINAAIAAARQGAKVLLVEATGLLGGNSVLSLVSPWMTFHNRGKQIVSGIAQEMVSRLIDNHQSIGHIPDPIGFCDTITPIDSEGAKALFFEMIDEAGVDLLLHGTVVAVTKGDHTLQEVIVATKGKLHALKATVIIDATGDGDVSVLAGAESVKGRIHDGLAQPMTMIFHVGNVNVESIRSYLQLHPEDFTANEEYTGEYVGVSGFFSKVKEAKANQEFSLPRDRVLMFQEILPNTVSINMTRVQGLDATDAFQRSQAEVLARKQVKEAFHFLKKYIPGFEESYILRTPSQIGIRETRHIIGDYVLSIEDVLSRKRFDDSIALSGFPIDIHSPSGSEVIFHEQEGDFAFGIPLRCLCVKHLKNVIVSGRCISATHEAAASLRVTPSVMAIGEAAGILAVLSLPYQGDIRQVQYRDVQAKLHINHQIFE